MAEGNLFSPQQMELALIELSQRLGSRLLSSRDSCAPYQTDDTGIVGCAAAVVLAESNDDLRLALEICEKHRIPITSRAGGTGRSGGAVPVLGGIVLATHRLNRILDFDREEGVIVAQPGVILRELSDTVEAEGWFYPPDPNSMDSCCVAGNVAENAAGPRAFKYGTTRDYVLGIETYLMGGGRFFSGRRTKKGVTGYDTTSTLVGSEGTLAVFGDVTLRLLPKPQATMTLLAHFSSVSVALVAVQHVVRARLSPRCIEFMDELTLQIMRDAGNPIDPRAGAVLLLEVDGDEDSCARQAEALGETCTSAGALSVLVASSANQRAQVWGARKQMSHAVRKFARHKLSEDVVVPRRALPALVDHVRELRDRLNILALCYGHAGDGNLHINFLWNDDEQRARVDRAVFELFERTVRLGGTLSGEHGIGLTKRPYIGLEQSAELMALQLRLKGAFDPHGLMNPGKIFPRGGHSAC